LLSTHAIFLAVYDYDITVRWTTCAGLEGETMSAYVPDGSSLLLMLLTIAVIGLAVWAVSKLFPVQRDK